MTYQCQECDYSGDRDGAVEHCDQTSHTLSATTTEGTTK
ncbi:hypothetical protein QEH44_gp55 [Arthrobacter phage Shambre1]|uniref:C2H2-type domain-containing protein n=1 Tax=Arthrobacter phage Shambre1 TaxID=2927284 RepID=A0A977KNM4_9CAUD|nr:hypothetical protein QEH44_gp55 [Arthrobacter phage Shambre1]UXE04791.1 hypothetical protein SEA_SHAMBRE1_55 [Arthrobacter phage Shambre1]